MINAFYLLFIIGVNHLSSNRYQVH